MSEGLSRIVFHSSGNLNVTLYSEYGSSSYNQYTAMCVNNPKPFTSIMIESESDWVLDFSPMKTMDTPNCSGVGSYVTDVFTVDPPMIVTISFSNTKNDGYAKIYLGKITSDGKTSSESFKEWCMFRNTYSFDRIIKPEPGVISYFWIIQCTESTEWSIAAK